MSKARFQFTLPQVAAVCVWLAAVFAAAHYALRLRLDRSLVPPFVLAVARISLSAVMMGYIWIYQRETLRGSLVLSRVLGEIANIFMLIGAGVSACMGVFILAATSNWLLSLALLTLGASLAATVFLMSAHFARGRRRRIARAVRERLTQRLIEGRALLDQQLPDEAAFADWQRQVAAWRAECERSLATCLTPRELAEVFAPSDTASIWIHRVHYEHELALGNLDAWLDRLRALHSSSRWR